MLLAIYPQKWLPYRYLWPFLRNRLDSVAALVEIAGRGGEPPQIHIIQAGNDELVPKSHGVTLENKCRELGLDAFKYTILGAFHTDVLASPAGRKVIVEAIQKVSHQGLR